MSKEPEGTDQDIREQIARIRFGLIAPLHLRNYPDASMSEYARRTALTPVQMPDGTVLYPAAKTIMRWYEAYEKSGYDALVPRHRNDRGEFRVLNEGQQERICEMRAEFPKMNCVVMREKLIAEDAAWASVSLSTVQRFVRRLKKEAPLPGEVKDRKAYEAPYANALWMADTKYYPVLREDGLDRRAYMIAIIDDYSRLVVGAELFYEDNAANFQTVFRKAIEAHGLPESIYLDNGSPYRNGDLDGIAARLGLTLKHTKVRDGAAKGKIERLHRTLQERLIHAVHPEQVGGLTAYNDLVTEEVYRYNRTEHSVTGEKPYERFMGCMDRIRRPQSAQWLKECFELRISRRVRNDSTVTVRKICYDVPPQFIGMTVDLHYDAARPDEFSLVWEGKRYKVSRTDRHENYRTKRKQIVDINYGLEVKRGDD